MIRRAMFQIRAWLSGRGWKRKLADPVERYSRGWRVEPEWDYRPRASRWKASEVDRP